MSTAAVNRRLSSGATRPQLHANPFQETVMAVEVRIPTILRKHTGGEKAVEAEGDTVRDLLGDLDRRYPGIAGQLLNQDGSLHRFVNVYVNDEDVRFLGALDAKLTDGDVVAILPAVAGGSGGRTPRSPVGRG
jgi:molybdopterin synthase sulfur carrier subunit